MDNNILLGNIIMLLGSCSMVIAGWAKTKISSLLWQTIQSILMALGGLILGSIPCAITSLFMIIRNILEYKKLLNNKVKAVLVIIVAVTSTVMNNCGWIGFLPIIAFAISTMGISIKDVSKFKAVSAATCAIFFINDLLIASYTSAIFNVISVCLNVYRSKANKTSDAVT